MSNLSWLDPTPHATAVYASCSALLPPHATLASRRPVPARLERDRDGRRADWSAGLADRCASATSGPCCQGTPAKAGAISRCKSGPGKAVEGVELWHGLLLG